MRPAGKGPLDSLYFHYPIFPVGDAPEREGQRIRHPVVIAGAGPIGSPEPLISHFLALGVGAKLSRSFRRKEQKLPFQHVRVRIVGNRPSGEGSLSLR